MFKNIVARETKHTKIDIKDKISQPTSYIKKNNYDKRKDTGHIN